MRCGCLPSGGAAGAGGADRLRPGIRGLGACPRNLAPCLPARGMAYQAAQNRPLCERLSVLQLSIDGVVATLGN